MGVVDDAAMTAVRQAYSRPESIAEAIAVYKKRQRHIAASPDARAQEMVDVGDALAQIGRDETAAVQAQIAGMQAGASPHAYAAVFADLAARRKDLEDRRGVLARQQAQEKGGGERTPAKDTNVTRCALEDAWWVLTDPEVPGAKKRQIIGTIVQRVVCQKDGARIDFVPGFLGEGDEVDSTESRRTPYTTCIGIRTHK